MICTACASDQVLVKIGKYKCFPFPADTNAYIQVESYDFLVDNDYIVPPSLNEVLVHDIYDLICHDISRTVVPPRPGDINEKDVLAALNIYSQRNWTELGGYRPWTHWNFVKDLTPREKEVLALEIIQHIRENGFKEIIYTDHFGLPPKNDEYYAGKKKDYDVIINRALWKTERIYPDPTLDSMYLMDGNLYIHFTANYNHDLLTVKKNGELYGRYDITTEWSTELADVLQIENFEDIDMISLSINNGKEAVLIFDTLNQVSVTYNDSLLYVGFRKHVMVYD